MKVDQQHRLRDLFAGRGMAAETASQVVQLLAPWFPTIASIMDTVSQDDHLQKMRKLVEEPRPCTPTQNRAISEWCSPGPGKGRPRGLPQVDGDGKRRVRPRKQTLNRTSPLAQQAPNSKDRSDPAIRAQIKLADENQSVKPTAYFRHNREIEMNLFFRDAWLRRNGNSTGTVKFQEMRLVDGERQRNVCGGSDS